MSDVALTQNPPSPRASFPINLMSNCGQDTGCTNPALFSCHHCESSVCLKHLNQHNEMNIKCADALCEQLKTVLNFFLQFNVEKSSQDARHQLDTWKQQMFDNIENIYASRLNEIDSLEKMLLRRFNNFKEPLESKVSNLLTVLSNMKDIAQISQRVINL